MCVVFEHVVQIVLFHLCQQTGVDNKAVSSEP